MLHQRPRQKTTLPIHWPESSGSSCALAKSGRCVPSGRGKQDCTVELPRNLDPGSGLSVYVPSLVRRSYSQPLAGHHGCPTCWKAPDLRSITRSIRPVIEALTGCTNPIRDSPQQYGVHRRGQRPGMAFPRAVGAV